MNEIMLNPYSLDVKAIKLSRNNYRVIREMLMSMSIKEGETMLTINGEDEKECWLQFICADIAGYYTGDVVEIIEGEWLLIKDDLPFGMADNHTFTKLYRKGDNS